MEGYHAVIAARVFSHAPVERMAAVVDVPVVNMLSDRAHPLQALADALTMEQSLGPLAGRTRRVGRRLQQRRPLARRDQPLLGAHVRLACPPASTPTSPSSSGCSCSARRASSSHHRPADAVAGADAVHTDTWVSMGQEDGEGGAQAGVRGLHRRRRPDGAAPHPTRVFMHCLPAYRGLEVTADVIDGPRAVVFQQGHNRLHAARGPASWPFRAHRSVSDPIEPIQG